MTDTKTPTVKTKINAQSLSAFVRHSDAVTAAKSQGDALVEETKWTALERLIAATVILGADVVKFAKSANVTTADALYSAFRDESSPVYVAPNDRSDMPSKTKMSDAMALSQRHTAARFEQYRTVTDDNGKHNTARIQDYVVWLAITVNGKPGSKSNVDMTATKVTGKGANRKVGVLVRPATATTSKGEPTSPNTIGFFVDILKMSSDELAKLVADGPDISSIPSARLRDVARSCMARATMEEMSDKLVVSI